MDLPISSPIESSTVNTSMEQTGKKVHWRRLIQIDFFVSFALFLFCVFGPLARTNKELLTHSKQNETTKKNNRFIRSRHYNNGGTSSTSNLYNDIRITFDSIKSHFCVLSLSGPHGTHTVTHFNHFLWFNNLLTIIFFVWFSSAAQHNLILISVNFTWIEFGCHKVSRKLTTDKKTLNQKLNQCVVHWKAFVCVVVWSIRHVLKIESERERVRNVGFDEIWRGKTPSSKFIVLKLFWCSFFLSIQSKKALCVCVNSLLTLFYHIAHIQHDFENNTQTYTYDIGIGLKSHTSFIHQVLSDMNSWRKERLLSLSHPCAKPSHFVFWLKRIDIIAPVFRPSNEHPTNKQTEKKTQEHFFIDVIIR